jgi:hypothetical protein
LGQRVLEIKRTAIEVASEAFGDVPKVQVLKEDLLRYERHLKSRVGSESPCPCPWSTQERVEMDMYPGSDNLYLWQNPDFPQSQNGVKGRRWQDLKSSAASIGCNICRTIVAMLSQRLTVELHEADFFDVYWNISFADTAPESLRFGLYRGTNRLCSIASKFVSTTSRTV